MPSLGDVIGQFSKVTLEESCLLPGRLGAAPLVDLGVTIFWKATQPTIYCGVPADHVLILTSYQIDEAVRNATIALTSALKAFDYRGKDLDELSKYSRQKSGPLLGEQALDNRENNLNLIRRMTARLEDEIANGGFLSPQAKRHLLDAAIAARVGAYHQAKGIVGAVLIGEFIHKADKKDYQLLVARLAQQNIKLDFVLALPVRAFNLLTNLGNLFSVIDKAAATLDPEEAKVLVKLEEQAVDHARAANRDCIKVAGQQTQCASSHFTVDKQFNFSKTGGASAKPKQVPNGSKGTGSSGGGGSASAGATGGAVVPVSTNASAGSSDSGSGVFGGMLDSVKGFGKSIDNALGVKSNNSGPSPDFGKTAADSMR